MMQATTMVSVKYEQGWVTGLRTVRDAGCWLRLALVFGASAILLDPASAAPSGVLDPDIAPMRVAVVGDRDGGWNVALEELGWKTVRHASDDAGWKRADESLDGVDVLLIPALDRPASSSGGDLDAADSLVREARAEMLWRFAEQGGVVVATGLGDEVALAGLCVPEPKATVLIIPASDATAGGIRADAGSTLLAYPERIAPVGDIPAFFKISGPDAGLWEVAGRRADNQTCVLVRRHGRGAIILATARLEDAAFLKNVSKLLELQRMGVAYIGHSFEYDGEKELRHGLGFARLTLRNTSGTNVTVRGELKLVGKADGRTYRGNGSQKNPRQNFMVDMLGVVDLHGDCVGEFFVESQDGAVRALVWRFAASLPAFLEIDPPSYRGMLSTARREPSVQFGIRLNPVLELVEGMAIHVAVRDDAGATQAEREVVANGAGRIPVAMPLPADAPAGEYAIEAKTLRQGVFEETARASFQIVPVRPGQVFVDQDGVLLDEGRPFFPLGLYHVAASEVEAAAKTGVNMIQLWNWDANGTNLARIRDLGVRVLYEDQFWGEIVRNHGGNPEFYDFQTNLATRARLEALRDDPSRAIAMWYTADEPWVGAVPHIKRMRDMWHRLDEDHPTYVVSTGDPRIGEAADVLGVDVYPIYHGRRRPLTTVGDAMANARAHLGGRKPVLAVLQSFGDNPRHGEKPAEVRAMSYLAVAHGVQGIFWYCWKETGDQTGFEGAGHHPETIRTLSEVIAEIKVFAPALLDPGARMMKSVDGRVHAILCGSQTTGRFLVYVNGEYESAETVLAVPELDGLKLDPLFGGPVGKIKDCELQLKLPPLATGAFQID